VTSNNRRWTKADTAVAASDAPWLLGVIVGGLRWVVRLLEKIVPWLPL